MKFLRNLLFPRYGDLLADIAKLKMVLVRIDREAMLEAYPEHADVIEKIRPDAGEPVASFDGFRSEGVAR